MYQGERQYSPRSLLTLILCAGPGNDQQHAFIAQWQCNRFVYQTFTMELQTKQKGNLTELQCITAFYELGYHISIPYGENSRYDFIADINGKLIRIQCKTSHLVKEGCIQFSCRSTRGTTGQAISHRYTEEEIEYFATFWEGKCYLVPVSECSTDKKIWFQAPKNNQKVGIHYAEEYELERQLREIK